MDLRSTSPHSDAFSDDVDSISMRDNALLKRSVSKHHNNNFKAGYVPVHEQHLNKTGLRGRKTFVFWALVGLLFILAVGNLILTITILGVLKIGHGMQSIELIQKEFAIKFFGQTDLGYIYKRDGKIEGYLNEPVDILADDSAIHFNLSKTSGRSDSKLNITKYGTTLKGFNLFEVKNNEGKTIVTNQFPEFHSLTNANSFSTKLIETNRITSPINGKLKLEGKTLSLRGSEGTTMAGKEIVWSADQDIYLKSINGSIILSDYEGTFIDVKRLSIATIRHTSSASNQYKVCVCMPQGKLFRIPIRNGSNGAVYCHHINLSPQHNPCI